MEIWGLESIDPGRRGALNLGEVPGRQSLQEQGWGAPPHFSPSPPVDTACQPCDRDSLLLSLQL